MSPAGRVDRRVDVSASLSGRDRRSPVLAPVRPSVRVRELVLPLLRVARDCSTAVCQQRKIEGSAACGSSRRHDRCSLQPILCTEVCDSACGAAGSSTALDIVQVFINRQ